MPKPRIYIGMGGNQGDVRALFTSALSAMEDHMDDILVSPLYESVAVGPEQPNYLNAVASGTTQLLPEALMDQLLSLIHI